MLRASTASRRGTCMQPPHSRFGHSKQDRQTAQFQVSWTPGRRWPRAEQGGARPLPSGPAVDCPLGLGSSVSSWESSVSAATDPRAAFIPLV